jgi:hypothetical protein
MADPVPARAVCFSNEMNPTLGNVSRERSRDQRCDQSLLSPCATTSPIHGLSLPTCFNNFQHAAASATSGRLGTCRKDHHWDLPTCAIELIPIPFRGCARTSFFRRVVPNLSRRVPIFESALIFQELGILHTSCRCYSHSRFRKSPFRSKGLCICRPARFNIQVDLYQSFKPLSHYRIKAIIPSKSVSSTTLFVPSSESCSIFSDLASGSPRA